MSGPAGMDDHPFTGSGATAETRGDLPANGDAITASGIVKHFGHVQALRGASITVRAGEIVALVGDKNASVWSRHAEEGHSTRERWLRR